MTEPLVDNVRTDLDAIESELIRRNSLVEEYRQDVVVLTDERDTAIVARDQAIADKLAALSSRDAAIAQLASLNQQLSAERAAWATERAQLQAEIARLNQLLNPLPLVKPLSAESIRQKVRVCDHANFSGAYVDRAGCVDIAGETGFAGVRGFLPTNNQAMKDRVIATARALKFYGMTWCATLQSATNPITEAELRAKIAWIAANPDVAAVVDGFEGINEWDNEGIAASVVVRNHAVMYEERAKYPQLANVKLVGASCHDVRIAESNGKQYKDLMAVGKVNVVLPTGAVTKLNYNELIDQQAMHAYPKGDDLDTEFARRLGYMRDAGITVKIVITETGWQQPGGSGGGVRVSEAEAADLAARAIFVAVTDPLFIANVDWYSRYELLVDVQGGDFWGIFDALKPTAVSDPKLARPKPEVAVIREILVGRLQDVDPDFDPAPVPFQVDNANQAGWVLFDNSEDGGATLVVFSSTKTPAQFVYTDREGQHTVNATWAPKFFDIPRAA